MFLFCKSWYCNQLCNLHFCYMDLYLMLDFKFLLDFNDFELLELLLFNPTDLTSSLFSSAYFNQLITFCLKRNIRSSCSLIHWMSSWRSSPLSNCWYSSLSGVNSLIRSTNVSISPLTAYAFTMEYIMLLIMPHSLSSLTFNLSLFNFSCFSLYSNAFFVTFCDFLTASSTHCVVSYSASSKIFFDLWFSNVPFIFLTSVSPTLPFWQSLVHIAWTNLAKLSRFVLLIAVREKTHVSLVIIESDYISICHSNYIVSINSLIKTTRSR